VCRNPLAIFSRRGVSAGRCRGLLRKRQMAASCRICRTISEMRGLGQVKAVVSGTDEITSWTPQDTTL
jgi:hypothetical protein